MFENRKIKEVILASYCLRVLLSLIIIYFVLKQIIGLIFILPENRRLHSFWLFFTFLKFFFTFSRLLLGCYDDITLNFHVRDNFV